MSSSSLTTVNPAGADGVVRLRDRITLHSLTFDNRWERDGAGLMRCGDVHISLASGDATRFTISRVGGEPLLTGRIHPRGPGDRDFAQFAWLLELLAGWSIPTAGLEPWFDLARPLASAAYEKQEADRRWNEPPPPLEQRLYKPDAAVRSRLNVVDLGELMRDGPRIPLMLVDEILVMGVHHSVYGEKECAKTWILAHATVALIKQGKNVVWVDWEMGAAAVAQRLLDLGATPEEVSEHLIYLEAPAKDGSPTSRADWAALMEDVRPVLVFWDAFTEAMSAANLDDNKATDIGKWQGWYLDAARKVGAATVTLDHTGHGQTGRARGSGHKGAAAKVEWEVKKRKGFDRSSVGQIEMILRKNSLAADLPKSQLIEIGGEDGVFVFRAAAKGLSAPTGGDTDTKSKITPPVSRTRRLEIAEKIMKKLLDTPGRKLTQNQLARDVVGRDADIIAVAKELADASASSGVRSSVEGKSIVYELVTVRGDGSAGEVDGSDPTHLFPPPTT